MTPKERKNTDIIIASRRKRIAAGPGTTIQKVNKLLKKYKNKPDNKKVSKINPTNLLRSRIGKLFS